MKDLIKYKSRKTMTSLLIFWRDLINIWQD